MIKYRLNGITQSKNYLCWEACARMLYLWKNGAGEIDRYNKHVREYLAKGRGLHRREMGYLYCQLLGMSARPVAKYAISKSPVIWTRSEPIGHAMVLVAYDSKSGRFVNWDPSMTEGQIDFSEDGSSTSSHIKGGAGVLSEKDFARQCDGGVWCYG